MALVDVKISQVVWNQSDKLDAAHTPGDDRIGARIDQIVSMTHMLSYLAPDSGKIAIASGQVTVQDALGNTVAYAGTVENPKASSGTAEVTSITQAIKGLAQETTKGSLNYSYQYANGHLDAERLGGKISYYKFNSLAPLDDLHGKGGWEVSGDIDAHSDKSYSGKIYSLSAFADKYLKSFKIVGDLDLSLPIGSKNYQVFGKIDSISMLYADKSYLKVNGPIEYSDGREINESMFSDPAMWNGDDNMKFDLPADLGREFFIDAGEGNDIISAAGGGGRLHLYGNAGNDRFILRDSLSVVDGGDGIDTIETAFSYSLGSASHVENLTLTGKASVNATGNALDNVIIGNAGNNVIDGAGGNDILKGGAGNDTYKADFSGNVTIDDASGKDVLVLDDLPWSIAWKGSTLEFSGAGFGSAVDVESTVSILNANKVGAIESIRFAMDLYSYQIAATQTGGKKNDMVVGTMFDDVLKGLDGDDWLNGSYGNDVLVGGKGSDVLFGCEGADIFRLEKVTDSLIGAEDEVVDFTAGVDKIDLTQLDANVKLKGVQAFTLSEAGPASNAVWFVPDAEGIGYALCGDVNGDATADFSIIIGAISAPLASDDILGLA